MPQREDTSHVSTGVTVALPAIRQGETRLLFCDQCDHALKEESELPLVDRGRAKAYSCPRCGRWVYVFKTMFAIGFTPEGHGETQIQLLVLCTCHSFIKLGTNHCGETRGFPSITLQQE